MPAIQIVCDNCGAKYRLPETFTNTKAKCKQCGSAIDVAVQRHAAVTGAAPAASPAAAARPAMARPAKEQSRPSSRRDSARSESRTAGRRGGRSGDGEEPQKKSKVGLIVSGAFAVVALIIVIVVMSGSKNEPEKKDAAKAPAAAPPKTDAPKPEVKAPAPQNAPAANPVPPTQPNKEPSKPVEANAPKPAPAPSQPPAASKPESRPEPVERWTTMKIASMDMVFDPKANTKPLDYPSYVTDEDKAKMAELLQQFRDGGAKGGRAKDALAKMGHMAMFAIVNHLRELDYKNTADEMRGFELNKVLEKMLMANMGYATVDLDEQIDPRKAEFNAQTVVAWIRNVQQKWPTKEKYDEFIATRQKTLEKNVGDDLGK